MTKIDETTGLPEIPWGDRYFWRVTQAGFGYEFHYLQLRKRGKWFKNSSTEVLEKAVHNISPNKLRAVADTILRVLQADTSHYVGDYPPKNLKDAPND